MRQHMLNAWLVAALVALVCLLGITAYAEVKNDLPFAASMCRQTPCDKQPVGLDRCAIVCRGGMGRSA
ncbi:hypothetical protein [Mesorhizobium sp. WSM4884]|uniref:hypothetical protein n=1 Tax=Mesorhizobium sp. WSM4884 TaxID=3038542 RepID=UPI00241713A4|nr:hypothetical protein [Mesorhizobium sp. WSM4884]MDG4882156.1 hypothetical protein [Mesorhizobium sp. WSM4884]